MNNRYIEQIQLDFKDIIIKLLIYNFIIAGHRHYGNYEFTITVAKIMWLIKKINGEIVYHKSSYAVIFSNYLY